MNRLTFAILLLCGLSHAGCADSPAQATANSRLDPVASATANVPPKQLIERIKQIVSAAPISLGVESQERGMLTTGWKQYQGDLHIARHWQERTRYRVEVIPDWDEPAARGKISVTAETEQRAAEGQDWDNHPRVPRPQRAQEVLDQIVRQLGTQAQ